MNITKTFKIAGTGKYVPSEVQKSEVMERTLGLQPGWSLRFSGVKERRHSTGESNADMAVFAINQALDNAGMGIDDIDLLISSSVTHDYILPFQAALILRIISGSKEINIPAMDVNTSCQSFVSALDVGINLLNGVKYKRIAIVSSEISSIGLNPANAEVYTLFGDGAAAAIIEWDSNYDGGLIKSMMRTYPEGYFYSMIRGGGNAYFPKNHPYDPAIYSFNMEGKKLLKLAKRRIPEFFDEFFSDLDVSIEDIDLIIPHQASKVGMALFQNIYPGTAGHVYSNLEKHGNCIAASIPMCLHETIDEGILNRGNYCLLAGTAAGFAIGGLLFKY
jgi:3-oxoacyl-[acyl-carrier-protein] synthase III